MQLTPDILRAAYNYLSETEPFNGWNLPDAEYVDFAVTKTRKRQGRCNCHVDGQSRCYKLDVSQKYVTHTASLMLILAHEMIHVHEFEAKLMERRHHGKVFWALAKEVCDAHGFDLGQF